MKIDSLAIREMENKSIWDWGHEPSWFSKLRELCPEAIIYTNDLLENIDQYRGYIKKQGEELEEIPKLIERIEELKREVMLVKDDDRCRRIAFDAYVSEVLNPEEIKSLNPF